MLSLFLIVRCPVVILALLTLALPGRALAQPARAASPVPLLGAPTDSVSAGAFEQHALTVAGDPVSGRALFFNQSLTKCSVCHKVNGEGGEGGPDLTHIGGKFDRPHLIESLLEPSRQIVEGYRTTLIEMRDGELVTGLVKEKTADHWTVYDAGGLKRNITTADIQQHKDSPLSLMPLGITVSMTAAQFTDLVAYLETLRSGGKPTPGAGSTGPIKVPAGFVVRTVATGFTGGTALEVAPDGRIFVCEQTGTLRLIKSGKLLETPVIKLPVDSTWERGLIGVTVDPKFSATPHVFVCYVAGSPYPHHIVSRFTLDGDVAVPGSEVVLFTGDDQRQLGGKVPGGHQGGALHFGRDGKLYVAIGDQTAGDPAQRFDTLQGKLLRLNPDGTIPADNPFLDRTTGKYRAIWSLGLRNPFTFAVRPSTGKIFINDVGGKFEEINRGAAGANFGWPAIEHGPTQDSRFANPVHWYPQASIAGGDFCPDDAAWPKAWRGRYFFADFVHGWIKSLDPDDPQHVDTFVSGLSRPVDLRFSRGGKLYVLLRNAWVIDDKFQPGTSALLEIATDPKKETAGSKPAPG